MNNQQKEKQSPLFRAVAVFAMTGSIACLAACGGGASGSESSAVPPNTSNGETSIATLPPTQAQSGSTTSLPPVVSSSPTGSLGVKTSVTQSLSAVIAREFKVNASAQGTQSNPAVANLKDGGYVIAWSSTPDETPTKSIRARRFGADGVAVGAELTLAEGNRPSLASLADGGYVLAYDFYDAVTASAGLRLVRYDASGQPNSTREILSAFPVSGQLSGLPNGGYTWLYTTSSGRNLDFFDAINRQAGHATAPAGIVAPVIFVSGDSVVHLVSSDSPATYPPTTGAHVFEQRFDASGNALGTPALRLTSPTSAFELSAVLLADGKFVIAYARWVEGNEPRTPGVTYGSATTVVSQVFDAAGTPVGAEVVPDLEKNVPAGTCPTSQPRVTVACPTPAQRGPKVLPLQAGGYVLSWASLNRAGLQGTRYEAQGTSGSGLLRLTSGGPSQYDSFAASYLPGSIPVLTWASLRADGSGMDVLAKQWPSDGPR